MARRYFLICSDCERKISIETTQAGQTIKCPGCPSKISIGTLRDIRALESADAPMTREQQAAARKKQGMKPLNRVLFVVGVLLTAVGGFWGIDSMIRANNKVGNPPPTQASEAVLTAIDNYTGPQLLQQWEASKLESLVEEWHPHQYTENKRQAAELRLYGYIGLTIAGIGLSCLAAAFFLKI